MSESTGTAWQLGSVSAHYEANGLNPGTVSSGRGDHGGVSYGIYQLSSKSGTVQEYLGQSSYGQKFEGLTPATTPFNNRWTDVAHSDANFGPDQRDFIARSHFQPRIDELKADGIDLSQRGMAVREALWSTSVQYRGLARQVFEGALQGRFGTNYQANLDRLSDKDIVSAIQDYKLDHVDQSFHSSSALVRDSIRDRITHEKQDLVSLAEGRTPDYGHASPTTSVLREGSRGDGVQRLQGQLNQLGYTDDQNHVLGMDGHFGASTRQAVQAFQRDEGLAADGVVGRGTWRLLDHATEPQQALNGAAPSAAGGVVGAVAGGVTGDWVGRRMFDRVKGMFGSPAESEAPAASPKPGAAPKAPSEVTIAGVGAASRSDVGAGTAVAGANTAAASPGRAVEAIRAWEVEARAMWQASVMARPAAQGKDAMTAAGVGLTASARSEAGASGSAQSGAGASNVPAVDGRTYWSSLAKGAAAASGGAGSAAGLSDEGRAVTPEKQISGPENLASASAPTVRLRF